MGFHKRFINYGDVEIGQGLLDVYWRLVYFVIEALVL